MSSQLWLNYSGNYKEEANIDLPLSKSISNRVLILNAISSGKIASKEYSQASDTTVLQKCLGNLNSILYNAEDGGTTFRFLTALAAIGDREVIITGSDRMKQRPVKGLVDALEQLGAKIEFLNEYGFPPIKVIPVQSDRTLQKEIKIKDKSSSQFISALMLIAPKIKGGLNISFPTDIPSYSYIQMTSDVLKIAEIEHEINSDSVIVNEKDFNESRMIIDIEKDWSGASYFFSFMSVGKWEKIILNNLKLVSIQRDSKIRDYFLPLGVRAKESKEGVLLTKNKPKSSRPLIFDFKDNPDLAMTVIIACAINKKNIKVKGIENLVLKESNRIEALQTELLKIGVKFEKEGNFWQLNTNGLSIPDKLLIETYNDHRIAMAFSVLSLKTELIIVNPDVVNKSFPDYWKQLKKIGINQKSL